MNGSVVADMPRVGILDPGDFSLPYDIELTRGLKANGCEVILIGHGGAPDGVTDVVLRKHFYRLLNLFNFERAPASLRQLMKGLCHGVDMIRLDHLLDSLGVEILHFQWTPLPILDRVGLRWLRRKRPVVLTVHDTNPYNGAGSRLMRIGQAGVARDVDAVIVHTARAVRHMVSAGVEPERLHQVPHGLLNAPGKKTEIRVGSRDRIVLLQFGKIKPYKGVDVLLNALARVPSSLRASLEVRIIGKPYLDTRPLENFVVKNGLEDCVRFRFEFIDDRELNRQLEEADAVVLPYREIDASGVAMTAIANGLPVLASAIDGFVELFGNGEGAELVTPDSEEDFAEVLSAWAASPDLLDKLAIAMRERRARVPGWDELGHLTLAVYAEARERWIARSMAAGGPNWQQETYDHEA
jgi:glycosyltransferase involved in cell wall biosynthesis